MWVKDWFKKNLTKKCIEFGSLFIISNHTQNKFNETDFGACAGVNTKLPLNHQINKLCPTPSDFQTFLWLCQRVEHFYMGREVHRSPRPLIRHKRPFSLPLIALVKGSYRSKKKMPWCDIILGGTSNKRTMPYYLQIDQGGFIKLTSIHFLVHKVCSILELFSL